MNNKISNNTSFGMALYMPKQKRIARKFDKALAREIEAARNSLTKITKNQDVDITVKPSRNWFELDNKNCWNVTMTIDKKRNPLFARIISLFRDYNIFDNSKKHATYLAVTPKSTLTTRIVETAKSMTSEITGKPVKL